MAGFFDDGLNMHSCITATVFRKRKLPFHVFLQLQKEVLHESEISDRLTIRSDFDCQRSDSVEDRNFKNFMITIKGVVTLV